MADKKAYPLRIGADVLDAMQRWAEDELRSVNAQIEYVLREEPHAIIWCGAIDEELTAKGYIVPGLGDAGDLAYGSKTQM